MYRAISDYLRGETPLPEPMDRPHDYQQTVRAMIQTCAALRRRLKTVTDPDRRMRIHTRLDKYERLILKYFSEGP